MKRLFETPQINLVRIDAKDVIVTSSTYTVGDNGNVNQGDNEGGF